ncbi:3-dehydroquinate synthase [Chamaesiphon sp. GL140_3_metabinner_50]|uniref:3-dehydroquinate synthase n=1 Tax=Chamaesiphon sp. GL140_3_metabinner_50 TaxID=2970812 RepID=UPI0025F5DC50|nr:3-dehydroquinate synthase [Chamaesiphon sp. GL140_3_metabinner_50]
MPSILVNLGANSYEISIASGNLDRLGTTCRTLGSNRSQSIASTLPPVTAAPLGNKVMVVSNKTVFDFYGDRAIRSLTAAKFEVSECLLDDGEQFKTLESLQQIYDCALENGLERSSTLVALGGGVIGDMTGFAAATWLRGINVVQVPTTLLAMVDSSIGGKTGVNHPLGKNLIGAFHQPRLVLTDPQVLDTLPEREFRAGMAEVIKYGIIGDRELFEQLAAATSLQQRIDPELLMTILTRSAKAKADVVSKDEHETLGLRATLNYGHTIGHAIESVTQYKIVNHGEAVAMGMVAAGQLAVQLKLWTQAEVQRQNDVITKAGLSTRLPDSINNLDDIIVALQRDKKVKAGRGVFILPTKIGETQTIGYEPTSSDVNLVSDLLIKQVLESMVPTGNN